MEKSTKYVSKKPNKDGIIEYTDEENRIWQILYERQHDLVKRYGCQEYLTGHEVLQLPHDRNPQLEEVSAVLRKATGWEVAAVPALISYERFFGLLAKRKFPSATFIRTPEDLDYIQEPDIFHEIYGHCPMLTEQVYADFIQAYGEIAAAADESYQPLLARLYWFTVEFGLIRVANELKVYGAGILSSIGETPYCIDSDIPQRRDFDIIDVLRTPYRIDIFQTVYFVIDSYQQLYDLVHQDLLAAIDKARELGQHKPTYPPAE